MERRPGKAAPGTGEKPPRGPSQGSRGGPTAPILLAGQEPDWEVKMRLLRPKNVDIVVRNERVGHRFPAGVLDAQDTWIEVRIEDSEKA